MINDRKLLIGLIASVLATGVIVACGGGGGGGGGGGAPAVASGTGRGAVVVDGSNGITGSVFFSGMSGTPTSVGIFEAAAGQNANPNTALVTLTVSPDGKGATIPAGTSLTPTQVTTLQGSGMYFLVKTSTFPNGELRGQIDGTTNLTSGVVNLDNNQEVPATVSSGTGRGTIVVDSTSGQIIAGVITYTGLTTNASLSHIHTGAAGTNGNIRVNFNPALALAGTATVTDPDTPMAAQDLTDLAGGNLYFNVHTGMYGGGEIRGQISTGTGARSSSLTTGQVVP